MFIVVQGLSLVFHSPCPGHNLLLVFCLGEECIFNTLRWPRDRELCIVRMFTCLLFQHATASIRTNLQKNTPNSQIADLGLQARVKGDSLPRYVEWRGKERSCVYHKNLNIVKKKTDKESRRWQTSTLISSDYNIGFHTKEKTTKNGALCLISLTACQVLHPASQ